MSLADLLSALAVGVGITSFGVAAVQLIMAYFIRRASRRRAENLVPVAIIRAALDILEVFILGPKRLDHEPTYSTLVSSFFLVGGGWVLLGPLPQSPIFTLPDATQVTLAACLFVGSGTCLYGIAMGTRFDAWRQWVSIVRKMHCQPPQPVYDLRRGYRVGASGIPALVVALGYYVTVLIRTTPLAKTSLSVILISFICLGLTFQCGRFLMEIRRINKALPMLIEQEVTRQLTEIDQNDPPTEPNPLRGVEQ